jgi:very-short-patch-repair endonuclease
MARQATVPMARALRRRATASERDFWKLLRHRRLEGLKFRRQVPIGRYILDFVCLRHRLVVELDGPFHDPAHDAERDAWLEAEGFRILRFAEVNAGRNVDKVIDGILAAVGSPPLFTD